MKLIYKFILISTIPLLGGCFSSCRGSAGKKAATEALELIEKKVGAEAASALEREASKAEKSAVREIKGNNVGKNRTYRPRRRSFGDDSYSQPQRYSVVCSQCGGAGAVYIVDYYGNIQFDMYGNPLVTQCTSCRGAGAVYVSY